jgi:hypothetical protein
MQAQTSAWVSITFVNISFHEESEYMRVVQAKSLHMFGPLKNARAVDFGWMKVSGCNGIVVPAAAQRVLCGGDPLTVVSMGYLTQHPWRLFLMAQPLNRFHWNSPHTFNWFHGILMNSKINHIKLKIRIEDIFEQIMKNVQVLFYYMTRHWFLLYHTTH